MNAFILSGSSKIVALRPNLKDSNLISDKFVPNGNKTLIVSPDVLVSIEFSKKISKEVSLFLASPEDELKFSESLPSLEEDSSVSLDSEELLLGSTPGITN